MVLTKYTPFLTRARRSVAYWTRVAMRDFTEELIERLGQRSRTWLADAAHVSPAYITKVLSGTENFTIETMTKLALAVGGKVRVHIADLDCDTSWNDAQTRTLIRTVRQPEPDFDADFVSSPVSHTSHSEYRYHMAASGRRQE